MLTLPRKRERGRPTGTFGNVMGMLDTPSKALVDLLIKVTSDALVSASYFRQQAQIDEVASHMKQSSSILKQLVGRYLRTKLPLVAFLKNDAPAKERGALLTALQEESNVVSIWRRLPAPSPWLRNINDFDLAKLLFATGKAMDRKEDADAGLVFQLHQRGNELMLKSTPSDKAYKHQTYLDIFQRAVDVFSSPVFSKPAMKSSKESS